MDKKVTTTNITYHYDDITEKMIGKTIRETVSEPAQPTASATTDDEYEIETGAVLEVDDGLTLFQTLSAVLAGGMFGIMLYKAFKKE